VIEVEAGADLAPLRHPDLRLSLSGLGLSPAAD
jgi:hypothetical protein